MVKVGRRDGVRGSVACLSSTHRHTAVWRSGLWWAVLLPPAGPPSAVSDGDSHPDGQRKPVSVHCKSVSTWPHAGLISESCTARPPLIRTFSLILTDHF